MSNPKITTIFEALQSLEQIGIDHSLIVAMEDAEYKELAAELGWTAHVTIAVRTFCKLRPTHKHLGDVAFAVSDSSTTSPQAVAMSQAAPAPHLSRATAHNYRIAELQAQLSAAEAAAALSALDDATSTNITAMNTALRTTSFETDQINSRLQRQEDAAITDVSGKNVMDKKIPFAASARDATVPMAVPELEEKGVATSKNMNTATHTPSSNLSTAVARSNTMQVAFVVDGTGSMSPHILVVKERIIKMAADLAEAMKTPVKFALVVYRDYEDRDNHINVFPFGDASALEETLGTVKVTSEADTAEDCFGGLYAAMTRLAWDASSRLIVWFGDAPNHGTAYNGGCGDSRPSMDKLPVSGAALGLRAKELNIVTSFIRLTPQTDQMIRRLQQEYTAAGTALYQGDGGGNAAAKAPTNPPIATCGGRQRPCVVYTAQPCNRKALDPFDLLLRELPLLHEERRSVTLSTAPFSFSKDETSVAHRCELSPSAMGSWFQRWRGTPHVAKTPPRTGSNCTNTCSNSRLGSRQIHVRTIACFLANEFNARTRSDGGLRKGASPRKVRYLPSQLMQLVSERSGAPEGDFWLLEPHVEGEYVKFNDSRGNVNKTHPIPQAFSHFTYDYSCGKLLIANVQGVVGAGEYLLTNPVIHTASPNSLLSDTTDRGTKDGIAAFFKIHVCNEYCKALGLRVPSYHSSAYRHSASPPVLATHSLDEM